MKSPSEFDMDCGRAWEAMPWALQNGASPTQDEWLSQHLAQCAACRAEFAQQSRLQRAVSLPSDVVLDANAGLRRLLARIDAPDTQDVSPRSRSAGWLTRALVAAVLVQALGIGILGAKLWVESGHPASYRTLSQTAAAAPAGAIHVVPDGSMTLADWNALLHGLQLQVVGEPNEVGAYTVVPTGTTSTTKATLQKLRASRGIRLAEPVAVAQ